MRPIHESRPATAEQEIDRTLLDLFSQTLVSIALGLAGLFAVFFAGNMISLSGDLRILMGSSSILAAGFSFGFWWILKYREHLVRDYSIAGACMAAIPLVYTLVYLNGTLNPFISTNLTFLLIAAGLLFVSAFWYSMVALVSIAGWVAVSHRFLGDSDWIYFGFLVLSGALIGFFVQIFRLGAIRRIEKLRIEDRNSRRELGKALAEADEARRRAEETSRALEEAVDVAQKSRERFQRLSEATFEAVMIHDRTRILDANDAMLKVFGYSLPELQKMRPTELVVLTSRKIVEERLYSAPGKRFEVEAMRKNGQVFAAELRGRAVSYRGMDAMVTALRDVAGRKKVESELIEARRRAEEIAELKSSFLANVSHEIRTPMNGVIGMTTLLLDTPLNEEQQEYAQIIRTSADSLLTVINDILDYSKIDSGQLELEQQAFSVRSCIEEAIDLVALQASQKGIEVAYSIHPGVPKRIESDASRLRQILANLLTNAVKFTQQGEIVVSVTADHISHGRYSLQFSVRDSGIGIPEARMHRLFKSFSQVDVSTTRKYGGTGLGLVICKRLAEAMDGVIWAESQPGVGSTFSFTITANGIHEAEPLSVAGEASIPKTRAVLYYHNPLVGALTKARLESFGLQVTCRRTLNTGSKDDSSHAYDIVIIDRAVMDDDETSMRHLLPESLRNAPVILITPIGHQHYIAREANVVVTKPVKQRALRDAIVATRGMTGPASGTLSASAPEHVNSPPVRVLVAEDNEVDLTVIGYLLERQGYAFETVKTTDDLLRKIGDESFDLVLADARMLYSIQDEFQRLCEDSAALAAPYVVALVADTRTTEARTCTPDVADECVLKPFTLDGLAEVVNRANMAGDGFPISMSVPSVSEPDVCSEDAIAELAAIDPDFLLALRRDFVHNAVGTLDDLEHAVNTGSEDVISQKLEYLQTSIHIAQATRLIPACDRLAKSCLSGAAQAARMEIRNMRRLIGELAARQDASDAAGTHRARLHLS